MSHRLNKQIASVLAAMSQVHFTNLYKSSLKTPAEIREGRFPFESLGRKSENYPALRKVCTVDKNIVYLSFAPFHLL